MNSNVKECESGRKLANFFWVKTYSMPNVVSTTIFFVINKRLAYMSFKTQSSNFSDNSSSTPPE
jgi:hypothetical protein